MRQHQQTINENAISILTLDDDPIITATIQAYFSRSGYRVDVENDPLAAIDRVRDGQYDILLLDFLMSPLCGDQVVEQIRRFNKDIFIILLTGHKSLAPPLQTIRALDIQGYYEKSDRFDQLELLVESCVKSIRQMKTIKSYKNGLTAIVEALPDLHHLTSVERVANGVLQTVSTLVNCKNALLMLDTFSEFERITREEGRFSVHYLGGEISEISDKDAEQLIFRLQGRSSMLLDKKVVFPISDGYGQALGLLAIEPVEDISYGQLQLLEVFARQASSAVSNAWMHALLQKRNDQLQNSNLEMVHAMRRVVDMKDRYTSGHSDRVAFYAYHLARRLGRSEEYCEHVRLAGMFHDTGKLSIPDEILLKPNRLTDEEYRCIQAHPVSGAELLSSVSQFRSIVPAVRSHHERVDGTGYPEGLKRDQIPEEARIIAVADTFDAMTSTRKYRSAMSLLIASEELERGKGSQLDAKMVELFQELMRSPDFWETAYREMGDCIPEHLLATRNISVG